MKFITALSLKVKIIIIACTVAAAAAVGAVIVLNTEEAYRVIKVFELNGSAVVTRENTGDIDAYAGMNLESGDTLSVEENSTLRISLDSDKYILLDGGTVLELIAQGTASDSRTVIELQTGTILNEIKNSLSANSSYEVNTPKATMAVRGTTFTVTTRENPDGSYVTELHTAEGTVSVQLFDENGEPKGAEIYVPKGGAVTILTEVNNETGNPADVDGDPHFIFPNGDGTFTDCGDSDPVYYPDGKPSAEAQTEQTVTAVPSDTVITETSEEYSETAAASVTTAKAVTERYGGTDRAPVSLAAMTSAEKREDYSVTNIPERISETKSVTTTAPGTADESAATTVPVSSADLKTTSVRTVTTAPPSTAGLTSATAPASMTEPIKTGPIITTVPTTVTKPAETTVPTAGPEPTDTEPAGTTAPTTEPEPTETETTVPTTEPEPTETETTVPTTEPEPTETETTETTEETAPPTPVYKVSFVDENGNILSEAEFDENETLGTLPQITDKKGYTAKWVSGGAEVTSGTVISADMEITAEYTPKPVTVYIVAPYDNDPRSTYGRIGELGELTVKYDSPVSDNDRGITVGSLTQLVEARYEEYYENYGRTYVLKFISINGGLDPIIVTDGYIISGDYIYENSDGTLYADIYFNYGDINDP